MYKRQVLSHADKGLHTAVSKLKYCKITLEWLRLLEPRKTDVFVLADKVRCIIYVINFYKLVYVSFNDYCAYARARSVCSLVLKGTVFSATYRHLLVESTRESLTV